jgi:small subunit ribosomal protein S20
LANSAQARKRARQNDTRREHNTSLRSRMRTFLKRTYNAVATSDLDTAKEAFKSAVPELDKLARKGLIHPNKAARHKARLNAQIKKLSA